MIRGAKIALLGLLMGACTSPSGEDGKNDGFPLEARMAAGIMEGSPQALGVLRVANSVSYEILADHQGVGLVERAVGNPTLDVLIRIASALEIEIAELFRFEEAEERSERASHDAGLVAERMSRYLVGRSAREVGRVVRIVEAALDLPPARRRRSKH